MHVSHAGHIISRMDMCTYGRTIAYYYDNPNPLRNAQLQLIAVLYSRQRASVDTLTTIYTHIAVQLSCEYIALMRILTWLGRRAGILHFQTSPRSQDTRQVS